MRSSVDPRRNALLLLALLLPCAGCNYPRNSYLVEIRPTEAGVERRVTAHDSFSPQDAAWVEAIIADRLERAYGARPDTLRPYTAQGRFADIPEDVGNWGAYRAGRTLFGSSAVYVERFRGNPHAAENVGRPLVAADSLFELVRTWCAAELDQQAGWPALNAHLEAEVRAPLRDIASAGFMAGLSTHRHEQSPYATLPYEHPELLTLLSGGLEFEGTIIPFYSQASMLDSVRVHFARVLGLRTPAESRRVLAFLVDRESAEASMVRAVGTARKLPPDEVRELWASTLLRIWFDSVYEDIPIDSLEVRFETGAEPYDTNGEWDASSRSVVWQATVPSPEEGARSMPFHCRASWAVPDSIRQRRLLGSVRLDGEDLASYCTLFTNLNARHQREWDRAVAALRPGKLQSLERFRFADERARGMAAGDSTSLAYPLVRLIVDAD